MIVSFAIVCAATAFVCTAVKEDEDLSLLQATLRLFVVLVGGIAGFALVIQTFTWLAG